MVIRTPRLTLRRFTPDDLEAMAPILADARVMEFSLMGPLSRERTRAWLCERVLASYERHGWGPWAVVQRENDALIGFCGLLHQEIAGKPEVEVAYRLHPDAWGRGLATEAAVAVRDHAFGPLRIDRLISIIEPANVRSIRVAEKNGMSLEKETVFHERPVRIYSVSRPSRQGR